MGMNLVDPEWYRRHIRTILDHTAFDSLCNYARILPSSDNQQYHIQCHQFLAFKANQLQLPYFTYTDSNTGKATFILSWQGRRTDLKSILLNSHMDVPSYPEIKGFIPPFHGMVDQYQRLYARGAQCMKSVGVQYLEAIGRLKSRNVKLQRTIHVSFTPDGGNGGEAGMKSFVESRQFRELNVGFVLDGGVASPTEEFVVYHGERSVFQFGIHIPLPQTDEGYNAISALTERFHGLRETQGCKLRDHGYLTPGDIVSIEGKPQFPQDTGSGEGKIFVDCRIPPSINVNVFQKLLYEWVKDVHQYNVYMKTERKDPQVTPLTHIVSNNRLWEAFKRAIDGFNYASFGCGKLRIQPLICAHTSDSTYTRQKGIPTIQFSPINHHPILVGMAEEHIQLNVFFVGIEIYAAIITELGNVR